MAIDKKKGENFMYDLTTYEAAQQRYQDLLQTMERERFIQTLPEVEGPTLVMQTLGHLRRLLTVMGFWLRHQVTLRPGLNGR
jgi:hypothetical protein